MSRDQTPIKRLYRSTTNRILLGVCGGLGEYFRIDPVIIRIIFVALTFAGGSGIVLYIVMVLIVPKVPQGSPSISDGSAPSIDIKHRAEELAAELKERGIWKSRWTWLGIILVVLGALMLLSQLFPMRFFSWGMFWAAVVIIIGLLILAKR